VLAKAFRVCDKHKSKFPALEKDLGLRCVFPPGSFQEKYEDNKTLKCAQHQLFPASRPIPVPSDEHHQYILCKYSCDYFSAWINFFFFLLQQQQQWSESFYIFILKKNFHALTVCEKERERESFSLYGVMMK
jgi:hypothetical protein